MGRWTQLVALIGLVAYVIVVMRNPDDASIGFLASFVTWFLFTFWLGSRTAGVRTYVEDGSIVIHNQLRTHRISLSEVTGLEVRRRLALWALSTEVVGFVIAMNRRVRMDATAAVRSPHGRLLTQALVQTHLQVEELGRYIERPVVDRTQKRRSNESRSNRA